MFRSTSSSTSGASAARSDRPVTANRKMVTTPDDLVRARLDEDEGAGKRHQPKQRAAQRFRWRSAARRAVS